MPVLLAADCSIAVTTLPAALRHRPDARVLWLDAHGDYNTPEHDRQRLPRRHVPGRRLRRVGRRPRRHRLPPSGSCWPACATSTPGERELLERSAATVIGASAVETLVAVKNALDGAPVFVHLDLDVLDPEHFPAAFPAPGGLHPDKLYDLLDAVVEDCELVGARGHRVRGARGSRRSRPTRPETAMHVLEPLLDRIAAMRQSRE